MFYNFTLKIEAVNPEDYEGMFGKNVGVVFAKAMEDFLYMNPIHEDENYYFDASLDGVMSLSHYLSAVCVIFHKSRGVFAKSELQNFFTYSNFNKLYKINDVREQTIDGNPYILYSNITRNVALAIIWGAYYYACIMTDFCVDNKRSRDLLYQLMLNFTGFTDKAFREKYLLMQSLDSSLYCTINKIKDMDKPSVFVNRTSPRHDLDYYINHHVYGQGYDSIASCLAQISLKDGIEFQDEDYLKIFEEIDNCVMRVMSSEKPEIEIPRVHAYIQKNYAAQEQKVEGVVLTTITASSCIGCLIEMMLMVAVYDLTEEKSERFMKTLTTLRASMENHDFSYIYTDDELWKLIADRIPPQPERPRVEDLQIKIERQEAEIERLTKNAGGSGINDKSETRLRDVEALLSHFDKIMRPTGFYDIPMIKQMDRWTQCIFILKLYLSSKPMKVALLYTIKFMDYYEMKVGYESQSSRLRLIETALGLKKDDRELKGNFNILKHGSGEDPIKYTAPQNLIEAEEYIDGLLSVPS